jgi:hypothetical protein
VPEAADSEHAGFASAHVFMPTRQGRIARVIAEWPLVRKSGVSLFATGISMAVCSAAGRIANARTSRHRLKLDAICYGPIELLIQYSCGGTRSYRTRRSSYSLQGSLA